MQQKVIGWVIGSLTAVCALVCGVMLYTKYTENRVNKLVRAQHQAEVSRYNSIKRMPTIQS